MIRKGWYREPQRHSMAAKGVITAQNSIKTRKLKDYIINQIKHYNEIANGNEWIAEIMSINGHVLLNDVQFSNKADYSELKWDVEDDERVIGYIHYHPPGILEEFSSQDFELAYTIHNLRKNKQQFTYTIMGVVSTNDNEEITAKFYAFKPKHKFNIKDKENMVESQFKNELEKYEKTGELIKLKEMVV